MLCAVLGILVSQPDCLFIILGFCCAHERGRRLSPGFPGQLHSKEGAHRLLYLQTTDRD